MKPLAMTYSCMGEPHYHRRVCVSLPSSGWDRVVPHSYIHQGEGGGSRCLWGWDRWIDATAMGSRSRSQRGDVTGLLVCLERVLVRMAPFESPAMDGCAVVEGSTLTEAT